MGENSKIEWTDHTVNLWWGCSKVHTGCKNCYAKSLSNRFGDDVWGIDKNRKLIKSAFKDLDKYQIRAKEENKKVKVFIGSMMDIFEDSKPIMNQPLLTTGLIREKLFVEIKKGLYPNIIFLFLTKRPRNIWKMIPDEWSHGCENVWFGTSVSDEETVKYADQLQNSLKFQNLFLSIEPQTGMIDNINLSGIDWVIQGGESGNKKRPFDIAWAYKMKEICKHQNTPYFFKQIDKVQKIPNDLMIKEYPNLEL